MRNHHARARLLALLCAAGLALCLAAGCAAETPGEAPEPVASEQPAATEPESEPSAATEPEPASEPAEPQTASFDMQSYTVTLPEPLASECSFAVGEESPAPGATWVGDAVNVVRDGYGLFTVACYSDDWGPQGMFRTLRLGPSAAIEGTSVWLIQPMEDQRGEEVPDQRETYATYVTLR
ncbi:hypothetical protein [Arabiibacter massiliensis]|uniref:hypothetical protein n=1 Tax=Arabiibacter massiliensis TaxID=1870985 RepID=UPI001179999C|nr:hypothetical protein [Arabiibacter massiliensis]